MSEFVAADNEKSEPIKTDIKLKSGHHLNVNVYSFITQKRVVVVTCMKWCIMLNTLSGSKRKMIKKVTQSLVHFYWFSQTLHELLA